ncbi:hypothetical protein BC831DRAFT_440849 [Entophlyctis helioformis]|nr:hypothetical protein BC831DRAFT_440849 [Entophlyctis helioformis]
MLAAATTTSADLDARIDAKLLGLMDLADDYLAQTPLLAKTLNSAFFNLAQAKYIIGPSRLTRSQYDRRMQALVTVDTTDARFELRLPGDAPTSKSDDDGQTDQTEPTAQTEQTEQALRNRRARAQQKPSPPTTDTKPPAQSTAKPERDPLHWYGVLVPSALRDSQSSFKAGLPHIVALANMRRELMARVQDLEVDLRMSRSADTLQNPASTTANEADGGEQ